MHDGDILALFRDGPLHFRLEEILGNYQKKILLEMKPRQIFSQASRAKDTQILTRPNPETHLAQKDCSTPRKNIIYYKLYT